MLDQLPPADPFKSYTDQIQTLQRTGHAYPTAEIGAPTLVWTVAFWPKAKADPNNFKMVTRPPGLPPSVMKDEDTIGRFNAKRTEINDDFAKFLKRLQDRGRVGPNGKLASQAFDLQAPSELAGRHAFNVFTRNSLGFTLWWEDPGTPALSQRPDRQPLETDLRIRVQAEVRSDYSVISFFIDAGKAWNRPPVYSSLEARGHRRGDIFKLVELIRSICEMRYGRDELMTAPVLPEPDTDTLFPEQALRLNQAADYLYRQIWDEFERAFDCTLESIAGDTDEVFVNSRCLVMSSRQVASLDDKFALGWDKEDARTEVDDPAATASPGPHHFARFDFAGDKGYGGAGYSGRATEPNRMVKAYAPFVRRMVPEADYRDWIACGVFDGRAILLTTLGSTTGFEYRDEGEEATLVPAQHLPQVRHRGAPRPFRYLLITKFEPHRKQVGRMVDRINEINACGFFALKDWAIVRQAGMSIRLYGIQLDEIVSDWNQRTAEIEYKHATKQAELRTIRGAAPPTDEQRKVERDLKAERDGSLAIANQQAERLLIEMNTKVNQLGEGAIGGLSFRINRSRHFAEQYRAGLESLRIGQIDSWWSYSEFAQRGMEPALGEIRDVGERLDKLRVRLLGVTQNIQTSSIVNQTEATRDHTYQLEVITKHIDDLVESTEKLRKWLSWGQAGVALFFTGLGFLLKMFFF